MAKQLTELRQRANQQARADTQASEVSSRYRGFYQRVTTPRSTVSRSQEQADFGVRDWRAPLRPYGDWRAPLLPFVLAARRVRHGDLRPVNFAWGRTLFSQFGEDAVLLSLFADQSRGYYVDVGAYHPFSISNTYALYRRGWRGILIEPDPKAARRLRRHRPRDLVLPLAVSDSSGRVQFSRAGAFAGIADKRNPWPGMGADQIEVEVCRLSEILDFHLPTGQEIDLLDVDCEGNDEAVLSSNDWSRYHPRVVCVEWHDQDTEEALRAILSKHGYHLHVRLGLTGIFVCGD